MCVCTDATMHVRGQLLRFGSLLPLCGSQESNSGRYAWWQVHLTGSVSQPASPQVYDSEFFSLLKGQDWFIKLKQTHSVVFVNSRDEHKSTFFFLSHITSSEQKSRRRGSGKAKIIYDILACLGISMLIIKQSSLPNAGHIRKSSGLRLSVWDLQVLSMWPEDWSVLPWLTPTPAPTSGKECQPWNCKVLQTQLTFRMEPDYLK